VSIALDRAELFGYLDSEDCLVVGIIRLSAHAHDACRNNRYSPEDQKSRYEPNSRWHRYNPPDSGIRYFRQ
jgi:hypothetical protein